MIKTYRTLVASLVFMSGSVYADCLPVGADLQSIPGYIGSYRTTISDQDRRNSSGQPIKGMKAFLQQDRANVNRFNRADPRDQKDNFFTTPQNRQLFQSADYRGRCGKDYVELINALDQSGRNAMVDVHAVRAGSGLTLYVELTDINASAQASAQTNAPQAVNRATNEPPKTQANPVRKTKKSFNQMLLDRLGPQGWAKCASSQIALSAINARDGSLGKSAADANRQLGLVLGDLRKLMLAQGYSSSALDRFFAAESRSIRTGDQAFANVANCLDKVTSVIDEFESLKKSSATPPTAPSLSQGQAKSANADPLAPLEFLFDPRKRWVGAKETTKSGESCEALLAKNQATMIMHQYTPTKTFMRTRVGGQHPRRNDPNTQKYGTFDVVTFSNYSVVSDGPVVSYVVVGKAPNSPALYTSPWELDKERGTLTRTARTTCKGCDATMQKFVASEPETIVKYWCSN